MYYTEESIGSVIWGLISDLWDFLKKVWYQIINFFKNIVSFFRERRRLEILEKEKNKIAIVVQDRLKNGDYNVVNCLFNTDNGQLVNPKEDALVMQSKELDNDTREKFGNKTMIVLK